MGTKQRGLLTTAAVVAIGILLPVAGASAMVSGSVEDRTVATGGLSPTSKPEAQSFQRAPTVTAPKRGCGLSCVKRSLNKLIKAHNNLVDAYNGLASDYYNCEQTKPVTQYYGYDYGFNSGLTTALDFTATGGVPSNQVVVYVC